MNKRIKEIEDKILNGHKVNKKEVLSPSSVSKNETNGKRIRRF